MKKTVEVDVILCPEEIAECLEHLDAAEFAVMLNTLGVLMNSWGNNSPGRAIMQMDHVAMSAKLTDDGRFASRMIAKIHEDA